MGILIVSLLLRRRGYRVLYLGPDLPVEELGGVIARLRPDVVCLSVTTLDSAERLLQAADWLSTVIKGPTRLAFGGQAFQANPDLITALPGHYLGVTARESLQAVAQLLEEVR